MDPDLITWVPIYPSLTTVWQLLSQPPAWDEVASESASSLGYHKALRVLTGNPDLPIFPPWGTIWHRGLAMGKDFVTMQYGIVRPLALVFGTP